MSEENSPGENQDMSLGSDQEQEVEDNPTNEDSVKSALDTDENENPDSETGDSVKGINLETNEDSVEAEAMETEGNDDNDENSEKAEAKDSKSPVTIDDDDDDDDGIEILDEVISNKPRSNNTSSTENKKKPTDTEAEDDDDKNMPTISINSSIFDNADDEDEDEQNTSMDISNMMQIEFNDDDSNGSNNSGQRMKPRRAAARAAEDSIKKVISLEKDKNPDRVNHYGSSNAVSNTKSDGGEKHQCHQCKKIEKSMIVVKQFGTDIHLCSNTCFNAFRNPDPSRRPLACAKCGALSRDIESAKTYYWETMNFCTDFCVANFQMEVGSQCSSCGKKVFWHSLGKYCVRFGSDIRQFCTSTCLESYKKNARVCFHCQLDIKRLGNVVLANIPAKSQPKEFCSQECVEMYVEQNLNQQIVSKPDVMINCSCCALHKKLFKELVLNSVSYRTCSELCWKKLLTVRKVQQPTKCETCTKYINMEGILPSFYVACGDAKTSGFCSPTCKNVFVLKHRQILSCTTCKVKKYNYDLIQFVSTRKTEFVVCSLNCLPRPSQYISNMKATLLLNEPSASAAPTSTSSSLPISSSTSTDITGLTNGPTRCFPQSIASSNVTVRPANNDDIIEIRDRYSNWKAKEEEVSLEDQRWAECETLVIVREPEPIQMRNKACMVRPLRITKDTQTDTEELWEMPRIEMRPDAEEKVIYVPVPIPYPVYLPFPFYALQTPAPTPFPVPIPIPIPIPVDSDYFSSNDQANNSNPTEEEKS